MKHKKGFILCLACVIFFSAFLWYNSKQGPTSSNQMFALGEDGSILEIQSEKVQVDNFQLSLEESLKGIDGVNMAVVSRGREGELVSYHVFVLGETTSIESDVLSYIEQLDGYFVNDITSYDDQMRIELSAS